MEKKTNIPAHKVPSLLSALVVLIIDVAILMLSVTVFDLEIQMALIICCVITGIYAFILGFKWDEIQQMMMDGVYSMLIATFILLLIGGVIATWIASGTIPYIIYIGLKLINPKVFLLCACLAASFMSIACGSSWSSAGTVGIAFMGIGAGLGINPAMTAGAIVSGAYFGDKQSPFSDTTNLASAMAETSLFDHMRSMMWSTVPAYLCTLVAYTLLGFAGVGSKTDTSAADMYVEELSKNFNLGIWLLIPVLALLYVIIKKAPAIPGLVVSIALGVIFAMIFQHETLLQVLGECFNGFKIDSGSDEIDSLLNRGGISSMLWTVCLYFSACILGQMLHVTGTLEVILAKIAAVTRSARTLIPTTLLTSFCMCALTGSLESSMLITSKLYGPAYDRLGLERRVLSRSLEDAGTMMCALIPWNSNGMFMATTLGVATISYIPYAFLGLLTPIFSLLLAITGIGVFYVDGRHLKKNKKKEA